MCIASMYEIICYYVEDPNRRVLVELRWWDFGVQMLKSSGRRFLNAISFI